MSKKDEFKNFAKSHPELIKHVSNNNMSWQKFYEIYDIYGAEDSAWSNYIQKPQIAESAQSVKKAATAGGLAGLTSIFKKADVNNIQKHIGTAQKAINLFQEMSTKDATKSLGALAAKPSLARPLNKFFED